MYYRDKVPHISGELARYSHDCWLLFGKCPGNKTSSDFACWLRGRPPTPGWTFVRISLLQLDGSDDDNQRPLYQGPEQTKLSQAQGHLKEACNTCQFKRVR